MSELITFKLLDFNSAAQLETIELRDKILRKPLGLQFTGEQLAAEKDMFHLAGYCNDKLVCCMVLQKTENGALKMRQVAVDENQQKKGYGQLMTAWMENWAKENGFKRIYCHARDIAVPFYEKMYYKIYGERFVEVSIPHFKMEKYI